MCIGLVEQWSVVKFEGIGHEVEVKHEDGLGRQAKPFGWVTQVAHAAQVS